MQDENIAEWKAILKNILKKAVEIKENEEKMT